MPVDMSQIRQALESVPSAPSDRVLVTSKSSMVLTPVVANNQLLYRNAVDNFGQNVIIFPAIVLENSSTSQTVDVNGKVVYAIGRPSIFNNILKFADANVDEETGVVPDIYTEINDGKLSVLGTAFNVRFEASGGKKAYTVTNLREAKANTLFNKLNLSVGTELSMPERDMDTFVTDYVAWALKTKAEWEAKQPNLFTAPNTPSTF